MRVGSGKIRTKFKNGGCLEVSRKIRKVVASTLALAMMTGTAGSFPAGQFAIINAATA